MRHADFRREALALLRELEWFDNYGGDHYCLVCKSLRHEGEKHKRRCRLAMLLRAGPEERVIVATEGGTR